MRRRTVLRSGGAAATLWLAGCAGRSPDDEGDEPADAESTTESTTTERAVTTTEQTTTATPTPTDQRLTVGSRDCGAGEQAAAVSFDATAEAVVIDGVTSAPDPCHVPEAERVAYDESTGTLAVTVTAVEEEASACATCIADLEYELRVSFDGGLPERVTVDHDGRTRRRVTEATRGK